ncbi:ABC transporter permease [Pseudonocardia kongjuensis]|uniref:ABC transporter permease n=1 Tax=Pseudonocardia kongjuensis TaxID=102227 RepID=A0ABP4I7I2_9PSEU
MRSATSWPAIDPRVRYLGSRILQGLFVIWAAFSLTFLMLWWLPGDAVVARLGGTGEGADVPPEQVAALRAEYGLDRPLPVQYGEQLRGLATGDLGVSVRTGVPVTEVIGGALPPTLLLAATALGGAVLAGTLFALVATAVPGRVARRVLIGLPAVGISVPTFWVGLVLLTVFSFQLRWFPSVGDAGPAGLVLPSVTLALPAGAMYTQMLIASMRESLAEPFVETARMKGLGPVAVHVRHAARTALVPPVTMLGLLVGNVVAGAVVIETVFSRAGLGRVTVDAVDLQDIPVIQGLVVVGAVVYVLAGLLVDLLYPVLDPRVRLTSGAGR